MSERFFSDEPIQGKQATLADQEAHHLLHVMRLKPGARVTLFDGGGAEFDAEVTCCGRKEVELAVLARYEIDRELPAPLVVAVAMPKGDRQRWLVEKLTELGATALVPIVTERTVGKLFDSNLGKLRRAVIEASKQCRRNWLMAIAEPVGWSDLLNDDQLPPSRWIAHPADDASAGLATAGEGVLIAIGPEGGFTEAEAASALAAGWSPLPLGPRILRTETAAITAAALAASGLHAGQG